MSGCVPLTRLPLGGAARIAFVPPGGLQVRLASLGLVAGVLVELRQIAPVVIVSSGATTLGLEPALAAEILVQLERGAEPA